MICKTYIQNKLGGDKFYIIINDNNLEKDYFVNNINNDKIYLFSVMNKNNIYIFKPNLEKKYPYKSNFKCIFNFDTYNNINLIIYIK